jgi:hypothetical protein
VHIANIILFIFAAIGMTHIVVDGLIFESPRNWLQKHLPEKIYKVFECYQCAGFWCGMIAGYFTVAMFMPFWSQIPVAFFCGCAGSYLSAVAAIHMNALEAQTVIGGLNDGD